MIIKIEQYKNIKDISFKVVNNKIIIVGKNNVGKSNFLDALYYAHYDVIDKKREYKDTIYLNDGLFKKGNDYFSSNCEFVKLFKIAYNILDDDKLQTAFLESELNRLLLLDNPYINGKIQVEVISDNEFALNFYDNSSARVISISDSVKKRLTYRLLRNISIANIPDNYVFLVDSPELYAHPSMIKALSYELRHLAKLGNLIVVVTHSESVVEYLYTDIREILKFTNEENNVKLYQINLAEYTKQVQEFYDHRGIYKLPNGKYNSSLDYIINEELEAFCKTILRDKTFKILFADIIFIGEGASEEILFDYIFAYKEIETVYENNIDYFTAFGKFYLPFFFILANLYNVNVVCLYDVDSLDNRSHNAFNQTFHDYQAKNRNKFVLVPLKPNLETELGIAMPSHRIEKPLHIYTSLYREKTNVNHIRQIVNNAIKKFH